MGKRRSEGWPRDAMCERRQNRQLSHGRSKTWLWSPFAIYLVLALAAPPLASAASTSPNSAPAGAHVEPATQTPEEEAAAVQDGTSPQMLRVVYAGSPPFVTGDREPSGRSIEVWKKMALQMRVDYELVAAPSIDQALSLVEAGDADVAVGPISITAKRAQKIAFTQPYATSSLAIAAKVDTSALTRFRPFMTKAFFSALLALLLVLGLVGTLIWLAERKTNSEHFPREPWRGIGNGIWFALVTMTTVGYGDRAPSTPVGRVVAGVWMLVALITVSSLTAGIATALTLSQIGGSEVPTADQLDGRRVVTLEGTTSERFARRHGAVVLTEKTLDRAISRLQQDAADAVVFDRPALEYYLSEHLNVELHLASQRYQEHGYGFAVSQESRLRARMDHVLLALREADAAITSGAER